MKKAISLLFALAMCLSLCACGGSGDSTGSLEENEKETSQQESTWNITYTTDEFGDVTEDSIAKISGVFEGSFSNTATPESDLTVIVNFEKRGNYNHYIASFDLKEYNKTNATYTSGEQITFKTKIGDEISEDVLVGSPPNGSLTLGAAEYSWGADDFYNALYEGKDVRCIITIGTSEYQFTATGDNFSSVCEQNGYGIAAEDLTVKEAVKILVEDYCLYNRYAGDWIKKNTDKLELMKTDEILDCIPKNGH